MYIKKDFLLEHLNLKKEGSLKELGVCAVFGVPSIDPFLPFAFLKL
jgi:hypothetical protein